MKMKAILLPDNKPWVYNEYDSIGRVRKQTSAAGEVMELYYDDEEGKLRQVRDAQGQTTKMEYNKEGYVTKVERPDGSVIEAAYDERKNLCMLMSGGKKKGRFVYDELNRLILSEDAGGRETHYSYTVFDKLSRIQRWDKSFQEMSYDSLRRLRQIRDYDGECLTMDYDAKGNLSQVTDKEGKAYKRYYNEKNQMERAEAPNGAKTTFAYDGKGRLVQTTNPLGGSIKTIQIGEEKMDIQYDPIGRITEIVSPWGEAISFAYNPQGFLEEARTKEGVLFTKQYNALGKVVERKESNGRERKYVYDGRGNLTEIKDNLRGDYRYAYEDGYIIYGEHNGCKEYYTYDESRKVIRKSRGEGEWEEYAYDPDNRLLRKKDHAGKETSYTYNALGQIREIRHSNGKWKQYRYSPSGNLLGVKEENGRETAYAYDSMGQIKTLAYGTAGQQKAFRTYDYDQGGNPVKIQDTRGNGDQYFYDERGRIRRYKDREGHEVIYNYEKMHRIKEKIFSDGRRAEWLYNQRGQIIKMNDWTGTTVIQRDGQGRIRSITNPEGKTVSYEYGSLGERTAILYPDGQKVLYAYGKPFQIQSIQKGDFRADFLYDRHGRVIQRKNANGIITTYTYDGGGRILTLKNEQQGALLDFFSYAYDAYGNKRMEERYREGMPEENGTYFFTYDGDCQLLQVEKEGETICAYAYDGWGNRTYSQCYGVKSRYGYNEEQELIWEEGEEGAFSYVYDKRGNLLQIHKDGRLETEYTFDCTNRLVKVLSPKGRADYQYNALGFRVGRREWRGEEGCMKKRDYILDMTKRYHHLLQIQGEEETETYIWGRELIGREKGGHSLYCHPSQNQSIQRITWEKTGNTYESYAYGEFGEERDKTKKRSQPFGYAGYEEDPISGTYYAQNREYLGGKGRFISQDIIGGSLGTPLTLNPYLFCYNRPSYYVDFDGRKPVSVTKKKEGVLPQAGIGVNFTGEPEDSQEENSQQEENGNGGIDGYIDPQIAQYPNIPISRVILL